MTTNPNGFEQILNGLAWSTSSYRSFPVLCHHIHNIKNLDFLPSMWSCIIGSYAFIMIIVHVGKEYYDFVVQPSRRSAEIAPIVYHVLFVK